MSANGRWCATRQQKRELKERQKPGLTGKQSNDNKNKRQKRISSGLQFL